MKILIADDDVMTRLLLGSALKKLGHAVQEAKNGQEAWQAWQTGEFRLVITDWMMPDMDGLELCRRVRAGSGADYTYLVLLTSRTGKIHYMEAMEAGVDDFINKPLEKDEFAARIRVAERILGLHAKLRAANTGLERRVAARTAELAEALDAKNEFFARASHELLTPMNHVLGFARLLEMDSLSGDQADSVRQILTSGQRLLTQIHQLLAASASSRENLYTLEGMLASAFPDAPGVHLAQVGGVS